MNKVLPESTQTLIIGGGIVGCSVAYHLAKEGHEVVLLERKQLTSGSTWHAAGLVSQFHGFPCVTKLACYGIELMQQLEAETGQATGFKKVGATAVAMNEGRREELRRRKDVAIGQGVEVQTLSIDELSAQWPLLETHGILEAIHFPNDGQTNPIDTTTALAKGARTAGAQIFENTEALKLVVEQGTVVGAETSQGLIKANNVVNCSGIWGQSFAQAGRTHLPIQHNQHFYIVSDPIAGLTDPTPVLRVYDEQAYYKEDAGKLLIGFAELNGMAWNPKNGIPGDFEFDELPYPDGHLDAVLEKCIERVPALGEVGIRTFFNGPEGYTPDGRYYLGEDPNVKNLFVAAGFNSSGIQNGPGAGMALAQWILKGHAPRDLVDVDVRRIQPFQANRDYLLKRGPETLSETYAMHWPYKQRQTMRGLRRSPIHEQLKQAGAVFGEAVGWERPMWFAPEGTEAKYQYGYNETTWFKHWKAEHEAIRNDLGLVDLSPFCKILVEGADAKSVLQRICTNNVAVKTGRVVYTQWLNERGGIEADVTVARLSSTQYLVMTAAATGLSELKWLRVQAPRDAKVTITDISASQAALGLSGPRARGFLSAYTDADMSNAAFAFSTSQEINLGAVPVRAQRISYNGELGWEIFVESSFAPYLFELLMSGEKATAPQLVGFHAAESLRTEKAYRHWGHDIGYTDTPYESGLLFASKLNKTDGFIGIEALQQRIAEGSNRKLLQFLLEDSSRFIYHNEPIYLNDEMVGSITTGSYGHTLGAPVGLGWATVPDNIGDRELEEQHWHTLVAGEKISMRASLAPMYDPQNIRIRG
ncbi:MAG: heterotetrameric sarcosine oxidase gamma subunit [Saprospiraceae bacterium]|jgi:heterotetrameric sarcosine oxidase gamma subunit